LELARIVNVPPGFPVAEGAALGDDVLLPPQPATVRAKAAATAPDHRNG
jgi:hypothetical protein